MIVPRKILSVVYVCLFVAGFSAVPCGAQEAGLFFREDWKETPAELPVSQAHVAGADLILGLYGPGLHGIKKSNHPSVPNDPFYIWSGPCPGNWALTLKHRRSDVDLTGPDARIRWRTKQAGFRQLRIILKLANGQWLVSDVFDDAGEDWRVREFRVSAIRWRTLDISRVAERKQAESADLKRVEEIGFTDLMPGGMSDACSRLDWIEVYGKPVPRQAS
jgi:hypothetical protein